MPHLSNHSINSIWIYFQNKFQNSLLLSYLYFLRWQHVRHALTNSPLCGKITCSAWKTLVIIFMYVQEVQEFSKQAFTFVRNLTPLCVVFLWQQCFWKFRGNEVHMHWKIWTGRFSRNDCKVIWSQCGHSETNSFLISFRFDVARGAALTNSPTLPSLPVQLFCFALFLFG